MHKSSRPQPQTPPSPEQTTTTTAASHRIPEIPRLPKTSTVLEPLSTNRISIGPKTPLEPEEKPGDLDNASQSSYHPEDGEISSSPDEEATYTKNVRTPPEPEPVSDSPKPKPALVEKEPEQDKSSVDPLVETEAKPQEEEPLESDQPEKTETIGTSVTNLVQEMPKTDEVADGIVEPAAPEPETAAQLTSTEGEKLEPTTYTEKQEPTDAQVENTQAITVPKIGAEPKPTPAETADNLLLDSIIDSVILKSQASENPPLASLNQNLNVESNVKESMLACVGSQSPSSTKAKSKQSWMHLSQMDTNENTNELKGDENRATLDLITSS